jgi:hypothetical protein
MAPKVFISYRRDDCADEAHAIALFLAKEFGHKRVLLDVDMRSGTDFPRELRKWLAKCKLLLVLIGPGWLNAQSKQGGRRLDDPQDWVRLEVAGALARGATVIPVLLDGAGLPSKSDLPEIMAGLLERQARRVRTAPIESFRNDLAALAKDIAQYLRPWPLPLPRPIPAAVAALLVALGIAFWLDRGPRPRPQAPETAQPAALANNAAVADTPPLTVADVLKQCVRDQRHPDSADVVTKLVERFKEDKFRYGWVAESQQPQADSNFVWHDITEATENDGALLLRVPWRNGRLRLVPVVRRQFATRAIQVSLLLQGAWSQDNGYGCIELAFNNDGEARGAIGVMNNKRLDTEARIERLTWYGR